MIAYDELVQALERWRHRQGLPATPPLFGDARPSTAPPASFTHATPPPAPRPTQAIAAAPPPPAATTAAQATRSPPPPPSGRSTMIGMAAPVIPPAAAPAPAPAAAPAHDGDVDEADVLEEAGDPYDNQGSDFAVGFEGENEPTRAGAEATGSAGGWPEARTVATHGWGQAPPARTIEVDDGDESTQIGDPTRHD